MALISIPFSLPTLGPEEAQAVQATVASGFVGSGKLVHQFEEEVARYARRRFGLATLSGSAALELALKILRVQATDEVIIPAFVCRAVLNAVLAVGATPVLADIDTPDLTLSVEATLRAITRKTKCVILPHLFGATADLDSFLKLPVPIIEDGASSMGATFRDRPVGSFGVLSVYSFSSTKMMTTGKGGMLLTDDALLAQRASDLLDYDHSLTAATDFAGYEIGSNDGLNDLPASLGLVQLSRLDEFVMRRREIAQRYTEAFDFPGWQLPFARAGSKHGYYRYVIQVDEHAKEMARDLQAHGIDARTSVSHLLYDYLTISDEQFPNCQSVRGKILALPIYPGLSDTQVDYVIEACRLAQEKYEGKN